VSSSFNNGDIVSIGVTLFGQNELDAIGTFSDYEFGRFGSAVLGLRNIPGAPSASTPYLLVGADNFAFGQGALALYQLTASGGAASSAFFDGRSAELSNSLKPAVSSSLANLGDINGDGTIEIASYGDRTNQMSSFSQGGVYIVRINSPTSITKILMHTDITISPWVPSSIYNKIESVPAIFGSRAAYLVFFSSNGAGVMEFYRINSSANMIHQKTLDASDIPGWTSGSIAHDMAFVEQGSFSTARFMISGRGGTKQSCLVDFTLPSFNVIAVIGCFHESDLNIPATLDSNFGGSVTAMGDLNCDGTVDFAYSDQGRNAAVLVFMKDDGTPRYTEQFGWNGLGGYNDFDPNPAGFPSRLTNLGDLNGDGLDDLATGTESFSTNPSFGFGRASTVLMQGNPLGECKITGPGSGSFYEPPVTCTSSSQCESLLCSCSNDFELVAECGNAASASLPQYPPATLRVLPVTFWYADYAALQCAVMHECAAESECGNDACLDMHCCG